MSRRRPPGRRRRPRCGQGRSGRRRFSGPASRRDGRRPRPPPHPPPTACRRRLRGRRRRGRSGYPADRARGSPRGRRPCAPRRGRPRPFQPCRGMRTPVDRWDGRRRWSSAPPPYAARPGWPDPCVSIPPRALCRAGLERRAPRTACRGRAPSAPAATAAPAAMRREAPVPATSVVSPSAALDNRRRPASARAAALSSAPIRPRSAISSISASWRR